MICWENYLPLMRAAMYAKGIEIYCAPTADSRDSWAASMRHIAIEDAVSCFPATNSTAGVISRVITIPFMEMIPKRW